MAPNINNPGGDKNEPDEIRDGVVSDATRFPGGFIDQQITEAGAAVRIAGQFSLDNIAFDSSLDISAQGATPTGIAFKPNGDRLFVPETLSDTVQQYSLSTAFDVTTATPGASLDVGPQDTSPLGIHLRPDGSQLYVGGNGTDSVLQYSLSTPYDVSTATFDLSFDISTEETAPKDVALRPDGSQLYVIGISSDAIQQYSLSTAFDISTATFDTSLDVSAQDVSPQALDFRPDGTRLYVLGNNTLNLFEFSLSTAFDVSTATLDTSFDVSPQSSSVKAVTFKPNGDHLYVIGTIDDNIYQYAVGVIAGELG